MLTLNEGEKQAWLEVMQTEFDSLAREQGVYVLYFYVTKMLSGAGIFTRSKAY